jgi:hypothetical protein
MGEMVEVVEHRMVVDKEAVDRRIVMGKEAVDRRIVMGKAAVEDGLVFDNIVADNIETVECMVGNIGAGSIVIGNIVDIGVDNHRQSLDMILGIHSRSLKDSHYILVDRNYIDKSRCFDPPY